MCYSILLAGGLSSRMGEDKAELQFEGKSLLQCGINLLETIDSELTLVSGRQGFPNSVIDIIPYLGPLGALYSCLDYLLKHEKLNNSPLLIVPVDMPLLNQDILTVLLTNLGNQDACSFEGEVFPCVVRASESLLQYIKGVFDENYELKNKRSMRAVLRFCNSKVISKSLFEERVFENINTPEDYKKVLSD